MSEEWKKEFIDTLSKKFEVDMKRYEISDYILMSLFNMEQKKNKLQERIDKALHKLRASKDHFKTERENNTITFTIRILEGEDKE